MGDGDRQTSFVDEDRSWRVVLLGPPGSGKGTQAALLARELAVPAISTGDMLRQAVRDGNDLGRRVEGIMAAGELVGDDLMEEVVSDRLGGAETARGFLLDGYPRTLPQVKALDRILGRLAVVLERVLLIRVPEQVLIERVLSRQRTDDQESVVRERLRVYHEKTEPLVDCYRKRGLLREVDGNQPIPKVTTAILAALDA